MPDLSAEAAPGGAGRWLLSEVEEAVRDLAARVDDVTQQLDYLTRSDETTQTALQALRKGGVKDSAIRPSELQTWLCPKCGARLGIYDPKSDELAVRYKDFVIRTQIGVGGWVETNCRGCAFPVRLDYEAPKA